MIIGIVIRSDDFYKTVIPIDNRSEKEYRKFLEDKIFDLCFSVKEENYNAEVITIEDNLIFVRMTTNSEEFSINSKLVEHFQETFISSLNEKLKNEESLFVPDHPTDCFFYKNQLYVPRGECKFVPFQLEDFEVTYDEE